MPRVPRVDSRSPCDGVRGGLAGATLVKLLDGVRAESVTSEDGQYRFRLERTWDPSLRHLVWIGLHPTLAAADEDDRLLRKLQAFTRQWEWGGIVVVNLFALRCRYTYELKQHVAPVGAGNDAHILAAAAGDKRAKAVIAGWGNGGQIDGRGKAVYELLCRSRVPLWRMAGPLTQSGHPWTPTRFPYSALPVPWTLPHHDGKVTPIEGERPR